MSLNLEKSAVTKAALDAAILDQSQVTKTLAKSSNPAAPMAFENIVLQFNEKQEDMVVTTAIAIHTGVCTFTSRKLCY